jgi:hypothetical protein
MAVLVAMVLIAGSAGIAAAQADPAQQQNPVKKQLRDGPGDQAKTKSQVRQRIHVAPNGGGTMNGASGMSAWAQGKGSGKAYGPGNGTGNDTVGPRDGSGFGPGTGTCTGPVGSQQQNRGGKGRR